MTGRENEADLAQERTIILHYHLFKNAGTSVDAILKKNFGDKWTSREFPTGSGNNTALVEDWIRETPDAVAYSSHTMVGPVPRVDGVRIISFLLLRDPIERIKSAYRFERTQAADTWGAQLAKEHDFEGYVKARLARPGDRQCRDFQTARLAAMVSGPEPEINRARRAMNAISVMGLVENMSGAMNALAHEFFGTGGSFGQTEVRANRSQQEATGEMISEDLQILLDQINSCDRKLLAELREMAS